MPEAAEEIAAPAEETAALAFAATDESAEPASPVALARASVAEASAEGRSVKPVSSAWDKKSVHC